LTEKLSNAELASDYLAEARRHYRRRQYREAESAALIARVFTERTVLDYMRQRDADDRARVEEWRAEDLARIEATRAADAEQAERQIEAIAAANRKAAIAASIAGVERQHELEQQRYSRAAEYIADTIRENGGEG
jgi:hypothetical protein